jgi:hypothetical protein
MLSDASLHGCCKSVLMVTVGDGEHIRVEGVEFVNRGDWNGSEVRNKYLPDIILSHWQFGRLVEGML